MSRVLSAARLQLAHPLVVLGVPWMVVATSFAINVAIWGLADVAQQPDTAYTGGLASLYITVVVVFSQAMTQMFPFAMGLSLSRRTYYLGTAAAALVQSLSFGLALTALDAIEDLTNGWGVGLQFWAAGGLDVATRCSSWWSSPSRCSLPARSAWASAWSSSGGGPWASTA